MRIPDDVKHKCKHLIRINSKRCKKDKKYCNPNSMFGYDCYEKIDIIEEVKDK
ncbi:unnamed protein product [marine sediment metagenome]|uniref:Uncharacterized protein n=1 Tax=marine sediment metagenome TaxID=412755 RepID=X0TGW4_9ZZZZ